MKAGLAILLSGITNYQIKQKAMFVFYGDEEYDFLGMKKFVEEYENKIKPRLVISADGGAREVGNACRGLIELIIRVSGKSGHSADPRSGINAITNSAIVIGNLEKWLKAFSTTELGKSTLNIAYIKGGTNLGKDGLGKEGNIIPDYCEFVVEIRVANPKLNANLVKKFIIQESKKRKLEIVGIKTRHDLGSWITDPKEIRKYIPSQEYRLSDAKKSGYLDIQMLWETFGKVPCFSFGPGNNTAHQENEYVEIKDIMAAQEFYKNLVVKGILK
jgi:succinyl-diaminopimelate desuccinylase